MLKQRTLDRALIARDALREAQQEAERSVAEMLAEIDIGYEYRRPSLWRRMQWWRE